MSTDVQQLLGTPKIKMPNHHLKFGLDDKTLYKRRNFVIYTYAINNKQ